MIVRNLMIEGFGVNPRHIRAGDFGQLSIDVFGVPVGVLPLVTLALAVGLFVILQVLLRRTKLGRIVRATADNAEIVRLMGVRPASVYDIVMGLSFALAGVAGLMLALRDLHAVLRSGAASDVVRSRRHGRFRIVLGRDACRHRAWRGATGRASPQSQFRLSVRQPRLLRLRHAAPERPVWSAAVRKQVVPIATLGVFIALAAAAPWLVGDGGIGLLFEVLLMLAMAQLWNLLAGYTGLVSMGLQCFTGIEVDILKNGKLDLDNEVLARLDVVVASIHSYMNLDRTEMTERLLAGIENPYAQIIAHPTGRLLLRRDPYAYDMEKILDAAKKHSVAMECNAYPDRLDLNDVHLRMAKERGVKITISTDSHSTTHLRFMQYGVATARRGWIEKKDVINALPLDQFLAALRPKPAAASAASPANTAKKKSA